MALSFPLRFRYLFLFFLCLVFVLPATLAQPPTLTNTSVPTLISLVAASTTTMTCTATASDGDGYANITSANATFYDAAVTMPGGDDDANDHYTNSTCLLSGGNGNSTGVSCSFRVLYYANPSASWRCRIAVTDGQSFVSDDSANATVQELKAISATAIVYYASGGGRLPLGAISIQRAMNITNTGNVNVTIQLSADDPALSCASGTIDPSAQRYNATDGFSFSQGFALSTAPTTVQGFIVPQRTDDAQPSVRALYWRLEIPATGVGGICVGTINLDAQ